MKQKKKILISGAGLSGLSLYLAINKNLFNVDIIEKNSKLKRLGYALIFMPQGVKGLRVLNFKSKEINKLGRFVQENQVRNTNGKITMTTDFRPYIKKYDKYMLISRIKLYNLLENKIPKNIIKFGVHPNKIIQKDNKVVVSFNNNTTKEYDLVIGADGANSFIRKSIFPNVKSKSTGFSFMWSWVSRKETNCPNQAGFMGDEKNGGIGFFDSGEKNRVCLFFFTQNKNIPKNLTSEGYRKIWTNKLKDFSDPVPKILKNLPLGSEMYFHRDYELKMKKWNKGNIVLIGDSAHVRSVLTGSGSGLAIEDAVVFGNFLNKESSIKKAIDRFGNAQLKRVNKLTLSSLLGKKIEKTFNEFLGSSILFKKR